MQIIKSLNAWKCIRKTIANKSTGFVPTMGNLHAGHESLLQRSVSENDITILSIFINPTQFNNQSDFARYPKTFNADIELAKKAKTDYLLHLSEEELYPDQYGFKISTDSSCSEMMEGKFRPGHFTGMLTIVMKLLLIARANRVYFGEKDYQQLTLVKKMAEAFLLDSEIVACPTIRNEDGLALSSRNNLLNSSDLTKAAMFSRLLASDRSEDIIVQELTDAGFVVDYIEQYEGRCYGAVKLANIRLIDNVRI